jgi:hypothetical protein
LGKTRSHGYPARSRYLTHGVDVDTIAARPGILGYVLRTNGTFRERFAAFLRGDVRVFWVAGEPANGKSTLVGDIVLALRAGNAAPLAGIAYDPVHAVLHEHMGIPLPKGETPDEVRRVVSDLLRDSLTHALEQMPLDTRVLVEAPLLDTRGEHALQALVARGHPVHAVVLHNPHVWWRVHDAGERVSALSARVEAMVAIREKLLSRYGMAGVPVTEQEAAIEAHWQAWCAHDPEWRMVLTWSGPESDAAARVTDDALLRDPIPGEGLFPDALTQVARAHANDLLAGLPDRDALIARARRDVMDEEQRA